MNSMRLCCFQTDEEKPRWSLRWVAFALVLTVMLTTLATILLVLGFSAERATTKCLRGARTALEDTFETANSNGEAVARTIQQQLVNQTLQIVNSRLRAVDDALMSVDMALRFAASYGTNGAPAILCAPLGIVPALQSITYLTVNGSMTECLEISDTPSGASLAYAEWDLRTGQMAQVSTLRGVGLEVVSRWLQLWPVLTNPPALLAAETLRTTSPAGPAGPQACQWSPIQLDSATLKMHCTWPLWNRSTNRLLGVIIASAELSQFSAQLNEVSQTAFDGRTQIVVVERDGSIVGTTSGNAIGSLPRPPHTSSGKAFPQHGSDLGPGNDIGPGHGSDLGPGKGPNNGPDTGPGKHPANSQLPRPGDPLPEDDSRRNDATSQQTGGHGNPGTGFGNGPGSNLGSGPSSQTQVVRLSVSSSDSLLVRQIGKYTTALGLATVCKRVDAIVPVSISNPDSLYVSVIPFALSNTVDWLVIVALPRSAILSSFDQLQNKQQAQAQKWQKSAEKQWRNGVILGVAISVLTVFFASGLVLYGMLVLLRPLETLAKDMSAIAQLDSDRVPEESSPFSEIRTIQHSFARLVNFLIEYRSVAPPAPVRQEQQPVRAGLVHRNVVIVLISFEAPSAGNADAVQASLAAFAHVAEREVTQTGGSILSFNGSYLLAGWNVARDVADPSSRAASAVFAMRQVLNEAPLNSLKTKFLIHSGDALVGRIGSSAQSPANVVSPIVDQARLLQHLHTLLGSTILATGSVVESMRDVVSRPVDIVEIRGAIMPLYEIEPAFRETHRCEETPVMVQPQSLHADELALFSNAFHAFLRGDFVYAEALASGLPAGCQQSVRLHKLITAKIHPYVRRVRVPFDVFPGDIHEAY
eukprot:TRINITY_DN55453_c0_g1_i1.p1 TRINITY_DN55453_c0_g1~~TRINITY_DN55453_c0_g1_i1.p1  ORF type:complete len:869 (-),score=102.44 TRINITY_DN55453_c0_g1_i1:245-2851(-)